MNNNSLVTLMQDGYVVPGTSSVHYYYEILDFYKSSGTLSSFQLDIPYVPEIYIYLVDKYYNVSTAPLALNSIPRYDIQNYFAPGTPENKTTAFIMSKTFRLEATNNFLPFNDRFTLEFIAEYSAMVRKNNILQPPSGNPKDWKEVNPGVKYRYVYNHAWGSIIDGGANTPLLLAGPEFNTPTSAVDCSGIFKSALNGQGFWIRLSIVDKYVTSKTLPYKNKILGIYNKVK